MFLHKYSTSITDVTVAFCSARKTTRSPTRSNQYRRRRCVLPPSSLKIAAQVSVFISLPNESPSCISHTLASFSVARGFFTRRRPFARPPRTRARPPRTRARLRLCRLSRADSSLADLTPSLFLPHSLSLSLPSLAQPFHGIQFRAWRFSNRILAY